MKYHPKLDAKIVEEQDAPRRVPCRIVLENVLTGENYPDLAQVFRPLSSHDLTYGRLQGEMVWLLQEFVDHPGVCGFEPVQFVGLRGGTFYYTTVDGLDGRALCDRGCLHTVPDEEALVNFMAEHEEAVLQGRQPVAVH